jgi:hypothetical protein
MTNTLPTNPDIAAGFEGRNPTPAQAQQIADLRNLLIASAVSVRDLVNAGPWGIKAIKAIQAAFSYAKVSVMVDPPPV